MQYLFRTVSIMRCVLETNIEFVLAKPNTYDVHDDVGDVDGDDDGATTMKATSRRRQQRRKKEKDEAQTVQNDAKRSQNGPKRSKSILTTF